MASTAGRLQGGVLTLDLNDYRIRDTDENTSQRDGPIWIFAKTTDLDGSTDTYLDSVVETYGRWIDTLVINP